MYAIHEKVVYPGHGVAQITRIIERVIAGRKMRYYELKLLSKDMTVLVPINSLGQAPIRPVSSKRSVNGALTILAKPARRLSTHEFTASCWNKRNKEYQTKLKSGGLVDLSEIYRDLRFIEVQKELSFGEKSLLCQIEGLLAEEIALVKKMSADAAVSYVRSLCSLPGDKPISKNEHSSPQVAKE